MEAATETEPVAEDAEIEPKGEEKAASRSILFYENGGDGEMESASVEDQSQYVLPECGFTAPEGTAFGGWKIGNSTYKPGDTVTVTEDMLLIALWQSTETEQTEAEPVEAESAPADTEPAQIETEAAPAEAEPAQTETEPAPAEAESAQIETEAAPAEAEPTQTETEAASAEAEAAQIETEPTPVEAEPEQTEAEPAPVVLRPECTIRFESGGADGEMKAVRTNEGAEYTMPECAYQLEGCFFGYWEISGAGIEEPYAVNAGDTIVVTGDTTATALWNIDESYVPKAEIVEGVEAEPEVEEAAEGDVGDGLVIEYDEVPEEIPDVYVDEAASLENVDPMDNLPEEETSIETPAEAEAPSEVGSVFSGAGTAAIIAALVLVLVAAGIAVTRKKKK